MVTILAFPALGSAASQAPSPRPRPTLRAARSQVPPVLDGNVADDPAWQGAEVATDFWQVEPFDGQPASEKTEVRILFDAENLYLGVVLYDRQPDAIVVGESRRDSSLEDSDSFQVVFDTFHDRQNGLIFGTNPTGIEYDGQLNNEGEGGSRGRGVTGGFNLNWNTSWQVETRVGDHGWSAEFVIPFRSLRYPGGDNQTWGLNFERRIARTLERTYWAALEVQFNLFRVSLAGALEGIDPPKQRNLQLTPYALGEVGRDSAEDSETEYRADAGLDVKYGVTSSLTLDATYNTDFAQVEADDQQINLDRFNLFFPEKRPFFLENAGLFAVGDPGNVELFFSRRIGLNEGAAIPILAGARLSGKVGPTNVGVLGMATEELVDDSLEDPVQANHFAVARVTHEMANRTRIGVIAVRREGQGSLAPPDDTNSTWGIDGQVGVGQYGLVKGFVARSDTPDLSGDDHAYMLEGNYSSSAWRLGLEYAEVGGNFNPEVGFVRRSDYRKPQAFIQRRIRPSDFLGLRDIRPRIFYASYWNFDGFHESEFIWLASDFEWRNGYRLEVGVSDELEGLKEPFEIYEGVVVPTGSYRAPRYRLSGSTNPSKSVFGGVRTEWGGAWGGDATQITPRMGIRLGSYLTGELSWQFNDFDLPVGAFQTNLGRVRLTYSFSTKLALQALVQYNDDSRNVSTNLRFSWLQRANSGLFVVYNELSEFGMDALPLPERSLIIKYSRLFDVFH